MFPTPPPHAADLSFPEPEIPAFNCAEHWGRRTPLPPPCKFPSFLPGADPIDLDNACPTTLAEEFDKNALNPLQWYDGQLYIAQSILGPMCHIGDPMLHRFVGTHVGHCRAPDANGRLRHIEVTDDLIEEVKQRLRRIIPTADRPPNWRGARRLVAPRVADRRLETVVKSFLAVHDLRPVLHQGDLYDRTEGHPDGYHSHLHESVLQKRLREYIDRARAPGATGYDAALRATPELVGQCLSMIKSMAVQVDLPPNWGPLALADALPATQRSDTH